jgi:UDP-N-acetylmuramoyl-tripeptide--D-alanyl-D-alanine ligase
MTDRELWTIEAMASAMRARRQGVLPDAVHGLSIDSRSIGPGEAFFAIKGDHREGHEFVKATLEAGASLAVVAADKRKQFPGDAPLLIVPAVLEGLRDLAWAARARCNAKVVGITGSVGKTGTKEALRLALSPEGETHASVASYNNHWGVPLSLARCPQTAKFAIFEIGMNHPGEIEPLARLVRPHVAIVTTVEPVHLEFFSSLEGIADAKSEIFFGLEPDGTAVINRDNPHYGRLRRKAEDAGVGRIISFGAHEEAHARLLNFSLHPDCSTVHASILGTEVTYKLGGPGYHLIVNSLAVLAAVVLVGGDLALAALALAELKPATGRGARITLGTPGGTTALLIDESYNANPASMRAALALLGKAALGPRGRRIAVLGDMLELGAKGPALHRELAEAVMANAVDLVFCSGPLMLELWEALPTERRGGYAKTSAALESSVLAVVRPGDAIMIKGSLGSRMGPLVKALERRYPCHVARQEAPAQG